MSPGDTYRTCDGSIGVRVGFTHVQIPILRVEILI